MSRAKVAITLDEKALLEIDQLVRQGTFPNRSKAIESAVIERLRRERRSRLARESGKLDKLEEQAMAEEGMAGEGEWPEY